MDLRDGTYRKGMMSLTLLGESSEEGSLIASGRAHMPGGKVIDDPSAARLVEAFQRGGFDRFALRVHPTEGPGNSLGVVWMDAGDGTGFRSLFLVPGARRDPRTKDLPDVYDDLKKLILSIHQITPGSMVVTGEGWSGDSMMNQKPGGR